MATDSLTGKQLQFSIEYANCLNGTEAARLAKYKGDDRTLAVVAHENLRKPKIRAKIDELLKQRTMTPDEVIARLSAQAESTFGAYIKENWQGQLSLDLKALRAAGLSHLIKKISNSKFGPSIEFHDPQAALSKLAQHYGLLNDGVVININIELVNQAVSALKDAGIDPAQAFHDLIAEAARVKQESSAGGG